MRWVLTFALAACVAPLPALNFNPPVWVGRPALVSDTTGLPAMDVATERVPEAGRLHAVWVEAIGGRQQVLRYRSETEAGNSLLGPTLTVSAPPAGVALSEPSLFAEPGGTAHIAWVRADGSGWSLRYARVSGNTAEPEQVVLVGEAPARRIVTPTVRAGVLASDQAPTVLVAALRLGDGGEIPDNTVAFRQLSPDAPGWADVPLDLTAPPPLGPFHVLAVRFDAVSGMGTSQRLQGALLLRCRPTAGDLTRQFHRTIFVYNPDPGVLSTRWAGTQVGTFHTTPLDEQTVVQSTGEGAIDYVVHYVHSALSGSLRQRWYTQLSMLPQGQQAIESRAMDFDSRPIEGLAIVPDDGPAYRYLRPLTLVGSDGGTPRLAQNSAGLAEAFSILTPPPRRMSAFPAADPVTVADVATPAGRARVTCTIHQATARTRLLVNEAGGLLLYNETGYATPPASPTPIPVPADQVRNVLLASGRTPTPAEFSDGDANGDRQWDCADIVWLRQ